MIDINNVKLARKWKSIIFQLLYEDFFLKRHIRRQRGKYRSKLFWGIFPGQMRIFLTIIKIEIIFRNGTICPILGVSAKMFVIYRQVFFTTVWVKKFLRAKCHFYYMVHVYVRNLQKPIWVIRNWHMYVHIKEKRGNLLFLNLNPLC